MRARWATTAPFVLAKRRVQAWFNGSTLLSSPRTPTPLEMKMHSKTRLLVLSVVAIATLDDLMGFLGSRADLQAHGAAVDAYRRQYGALESAT